MNTESHVDPKNIVVTGASSGIGQATAEALLSRGHKVALLDRAPAVIEEGDNAKAFSVNVADATEVGKAFEAAEAWAGGAPDAIYHMAGTMAAQRARIEDVEDDVWERVISINLTGTFNVAKAGAARLVRPGGLLVLTSSQGGVLEPSGSIPYGASKAGIHGLVMTLERQLHEEGIRVIELVPGRVDTALYRRSVQDAVDQTGSEALGEELLADLTPAETVGELAAFLLTEAGRRLRNPVATL